MFNCHSVRGNRAYWRCHNYSKKQVDQRCRCRCVIVNNVVKSMTGGPHNHPPHTDKIAKITKRNEANEMANKMDYDVFKITIEDQ